MAAWCYAQCSVVGHAECFKAVDWGAVEAKVSVINMWEPAGICCWLSELNVSSAPINKQQINTCTSHTELLFCFLYLFVCPGFPRNVSQSNLISIKPIRRKRIGVAWRRRLFRVFQCMRCRTVRSLAHASSEWAGELSRATVKWPWVPDWRSANTEGFRWQRFWSQNSMCVLLMLFYCDF